MTKTMFQSQKKKPASLNFLNFDAMRVTVASPDQIREWSFGEVKKPETINYRTFKPEREGLFCDRIFGPIKDWECHCGKYKNSKHKGIICDRCGVEVTESKVRRERFGHIELAVPVAHLWFLKKSPSRIGSILNMKISDLEKVINYTKYVVTDNLTDRAGISSFVKKGMLLSEREFDLFKYGLESPIVKDSFGSIIDGIVVEELVLEDDKKKALKQLKKIIKHQANQSDMTSEEAAKIIIANLEKGDTYYKCYFRPHKRYIYFDLDAINYAKVRQILADNIVKDENVKIDESDKKITIELSSIAKDEEFNDLRKNHEDLKLYEGYLKIETPKIETPFLKEFMEEKKSLILERSDINRIQKGFGDFVKVDIGATAVRKLLEEIDLAQKAKSIRDEIKKTKTDAERATLIKKLRVVEGFLNSNTRPEWMIITVLPVLPPELRPLVALEGGRFATSDLNDLYRRIINRNNRLRHIEQLKAPSVMINNEKRLLQEAVDALIDNDSRSRPVTGAGARPLKSLSDTLKGKQGRFRQNLLGKRVDYSGRSVIVVGPNLKLNQCGLPKEMALELFKPFIIKEIIKQEETKTLKSAKKMLEDGDSKVWNILENVTKGHPVLLNRAPTLHRLGIQAFEPVLVEGKSIQLHPLTCAAFNADFDGDQMAVHLPISLEAQLEAKVLMMATRNILSPASGKPIAVPSQDMVLGSCFLTKEKPGVPGEGKIFSSVDEVICAYQSGKVDLQAKIKVVGITNTRDAKLKDNEQKDMSKWKNYKDADGNEVMNYTTVGRIIFNERLPKNDDGTYALGYLNKDMTKKELGLIVDRCYKELGQYRTVILLDEIKKLGYKYATLAGISISINEMIIPPKKEKLVKDAKVSIKTIEGQAKQGIITESERYNKIIDIWTKVTDEVADIMFDEMKKDEKKLYKQGENRFNSIFMMADSGARGSRQQVRQLAGMRGLMAKPQKRLTGGVGEIIETPIISNFREGLTVLEYFISTHGGRKGLSDTALKTAEAGYLTRKLVDVAHDVVVREDDCKTVNGVFIGTLQSGDEIVEKIDERVVGRVALDNVVDIVHDELIVTKGEVITSEKAKKLVDAGIDKIGIRSVLTCEAEHGVCSKCYGVNPATGKMVEVGEAVGIIAAESIGEPGTQLTLRTFHIGGTASRVVQRSEIYAENDGNANYHNLKTITNRNNETIVLSRNTELEYTESEVHRKLNYQIPYGAVISVKDGQKVELKKDSSGETAPILIAKWDPHSKPIITEFDGTIEFEDIKDGVTLQKEKSKISGQIERVIIDQPGGKKRPRIVVRKSKDETIEYPLPIDTTLVIHNGDKVVAGDVLAKIPLEVSKSKDITGGLPRVTELFESRRSKNVAVVSEIDGIVHLAGPSKKGSIKVEIINPDTNMNKEYFVPVGRHLEVYEGDAVKEGDSLSDGAINPHDILKVKGPKEVQEYLVNEIQQVYRLQGVTINDKHIEIIVRQMLSNVRIIDSGDSSKFLNGEIVSKHKYELEREMVKAAGGKVPSSQPILLGITKASLSSDSFISAASFQETTRILTEAAVSGQIDTLRGLKENVAIGHLIPAGTGLRNK